MKRKLPICTRIEKKKLEDCILIAKAKIVETGYRGSPFAICRRSLGCRLGGSKKYERKVKA